MKWLDGAALLLILCSTALLMSTPSFHRIAERGHVRARMLTRASAYLEWALAPFALALGIDMGIAFHIAGGPRWAGLTGAAFVLGAAFCWFVLPSFAARGEHGGEMMADKEQSLEARIVQALTEIRVVLPGAQALFGFQVTAVLTEQFGTLPEASRSVTWPASRWSRRRS